MRLTKFIILVMYWKINRYCEADWVKFASSAQYFNKQLMTNLIDFFPPIVIPKSISAVSARLECSIACKVNNSCLAFNFYEIDAFYTCELLPDNFCGNRTRKALVHRTGSSVWDKLTGNVGQSCLDQNHQLGSIPCWDVQPGCFGTWPICYNCLISCSDCYARGYGASLRYDCTFWPETNVPVFGICLNTRTYLFIRAVEPLRGVVTEDYRISFSDADRLYKLQTYTQLRFYFGATDDSTYSAFYTNFALDENGTLLGNLVFVTPDWGTPTDFLNVSGRHVNKMPFVQVTDDRYGCGSFWLLDDNNSTHCPGGYLGMLGSVQKDGAGRVLSTGIKVANLYPNKVFSWVTVELAW